MHKKRPTAGLVPFHKTGELFLFKETISCHRLYGSYEALSGGRGSEAMEDFTGGIAEEYDLRKEDEHALVAIIQSGAKRSSLMSCSIS